MKWEYLIEMIHANDPAEQYEQQLRKLGEDGWEAVTVWHQFPFTAGKVYILLKRPR